MDLLFSVQGIQMKFKNKILFLYCVIILNACLLGCSKNVNIDFVVAYTIAEVQADRSSMNSVTYLGVNYYLDRTPFLRLTQQDVETIDINPPGIAYTVTIKFNGRYNKLIEESTNRNTGKLIAMKVGKEIVSVGTLASPINNGTIQLVIRDGTKRSAEEFVKSIGLKSDGITGKADESLEWFLKGQSEFQSTTHLIDEQEKAQHLRMAENYILKSIELKPDVINYHKTLAGVYYSLKEAEKCLSEIQKAKELIAQGKKIDDPSFYMSIGGMYMHLNEYRLAIEAFKDGIKLNPMDANSGFDLAQVYAAVGEYDLARKTLEEMMQYTMDGGVLREDYEKLLAKVKKKKEEAENK